MKEKYDGEDFKLRDFQKEDLVKVIKMEIGIWVNLQVIRIIGFFGGSWKENLNVDNVMQIIFQYCL